MNGTRSQINDEFLSYLLTIAPWHQIISLKIDDPLDLCQLRSLLSKMINLRTLQLHYHFDYDFDDDSNKQNLIDLFNDTSLCNILMSNGLQKLFLYTDSGYPDMTNIAFLIVKQLPHLQIIELCINNIQMFETLLILMNGLPKLNFVIFHGGLEDGNQEHSKMRVLRKYSTRAYRMEHCNLLDGAEMLYVWL
jgi:hypothetical protein